MTKLNGHYLLLFLAFIVLGPALPALVLFGYNTTLIGDDLEFALKVGYFFGGLPALLTGALVWILKLRRNVSGIGAALALGTGLSLLEGALFGGFIGITTAELMVQLALYGFFSALCFCPFLPRPEAAS